MPLLAVLKNWITSSNDSTNWFKLVTDTIIDLWLLLSGNKSSKFWGKLFHKSSAFEYETENSFVSVLVLKVLHHLKNSFDASSMQSFLRKLKQSVSFFRKIFLPLLSSGSSYV